MQHSSINLDLERRVLQHIKCDMATSRGQLCSIKNSDARISQIASYVTSWIVQGDITNHLYYDITKSTKWNNKIHGLQQLEIKHATSKVNHLHQPCHARTPSCHRGHHLERFYYCKICNWHGPVKWSSCPTSCYVKLDSSFIQKKDFEAWWWPLWPFLFRMLAIDGTNNFAARGYFGTLALMAWRYLD